MRNFRQGIPSDFGTGGTGITPDGASVSATPPSALGNPTLPNNNPELVAILWALAGRMAPVAATYAALAAFGAGPAPSNPLDRQDGQVVLVEFDGSLWYWNATSTAAAAPGLVVVPNDAPAAGRWLREGTASGGSALPTPGGSVDLKLAVGFATANGAVLYTVPAGTKLLIRRAYWEVTTPFTGGASSAIGVDSSNASYSTPGDILGGATGDVTAVLGTDGYHGGTIGTKYGSNGVIVLVGGDTVKFNAITSAYTAGAGFVHLDAQVIN